MAQDDLLNKEVAKDTLVLSTPRPDTAADRLPVAARDFAPQAATEALNATASSQNAELPALDTSNATIRGPIVHIRTPSHQTPNRSPLTAGLHIRTDITSPTPTTPQLSNKSTSHEVSQNLGSNTSSSQPIAIEKSGLRSTLSAASMTSYHSLSPGSAISSPSLAAMTDITPLPSPIMPGDSPGSWKAHRRRPGSTGSLSSSVREEVLPEQIPLEPMATRITPTNIKKKAYGNLTSGGLDSSGFNPSVRAREPSHSRNRSLSEFAPEAMHNVRPRHVTVSANHGPIPDESLNLEPHLHREQYLAEQRGLVNQSQQPYHGALPTPPASNRSVTESDGDENREDEPLVEYLSVRVGSARRKHKYRPVRPLGQGTFSKVLLATSEHLPPKTTLNEASEAHLNPSHLVAIKIVQHGPAGGADEERVELGLKREVEILQAISHPSLIHLQAFDYNDQEALLVLNYCPGGDLFDLASQSHDLLKPAIVQRMFSELVDAVSYLHSKFIVHRDIKLENVLLNVSSSSLASINDPATCPYPLITLTDLGLSRTIPQLPESPLLTTRCGSEDYAAPEILLSQPYDGRQTDAWALGVLLYALMEGRLPFDPPPQRPGMKPIRGRSRAAHRIARCDWMWCRFGDEDGEWDGQLGTGWEGARLCVDGLLKKVTRGRWSMEELKQKKYIRDGIQVEGGLKRQHVDDKMDES